MKKSFFIFFNILFVVTLISCSTPNCRRKDKIPAYKAAEVILEKPKSVSSEGHVFIYKYDGSLQCGMGRPVPLKEMANDLKSIQIFSQTNKPDGLMHIQVCGSTTGRANVYEISANDLEKAKERGFKQWTFK